METTKLILEIINTLAIVTGTIFAVWGIDIWKKKAVWKTENELARRYLKSVYKVRDAIKYVRNPFVSTGEMANAYKENDLDGGDFSDHRKTNELVYSIRWKKVQESISELSVELLEAEVFWGKEALSVYKNLESQISKLFVALKMFLGERDLIPERDIIYDMGDLDKFNPNLDKAIEEIENFLKPHLK